MNLFFRSSDLYTHYLSTGKALRRRTILPDNREMYAEVALDSTAQELADRLFTYKIPESLQPAVLPGSRVLVPFGRHDPVAGLVVSVKNECPLLNSSLDSAAGKPVQIKSIIDLLDDEPLFSKDYIEFLYWTADYYLCTVSEVIAAAIPAAIGPRVKRYVRLAQEVQPEGMLALPAALLQPLNSSEQVLVDALERNSGELPLVSFADKCRVGADQFQRAFASLKRRGRIETVSRMDAGSAPKLISRVIWNGQPAATDRQRQVIDVIRSHGGSINLTALLEAAKTTRELVKKLEAQGVISITQEEDIRDPLRRLPLSVETPPPLTEAQENVVNRLSKELVDTLAREPAAKVEPWLLHGVTGSGKTEIYLRLIQLCLSMKRSSLLLVPEISLTPQLSRRLLARFGEQVAIWHSALSAGERYDTWRRVQAGELRVVLGARSAVLSNIPDLGLIILDEEHDGSYKQTTPSPRYSAKKLAVERARREGALVLFGSATPDAATYFEAIEANKVLELPERVHKQALPESEIVDMRREFKAGNRGLFSEVLQTRIADCLGRKEQVILLMNRRGYASHVFCRSCGHVVRCRNCSVSLVFHNPAGGKGGAPVASFSRGCFTCHHCGFSRNATEMCPACQSPFLRQFGLGTQRVEEEASLLFPESRILRLDSDITVKKGAAEAVFKQFAAGEADILIGTQMIAKGIDIARVTLVGVIAADAAFNLPDYRALERGFQLLTQVSGRAGRGHSPGSVVLQTFNPDLPALDLARKQDYKAFIADELQCRKDFSYPPFSELVRIVVSALDENNARTEIEYLAEELSNYLDDLVAADAARILGPAPCLVEKLKNYYRYHLLIKNLGGQTVRSCIATFLRNRRRPGAIRFSIDIDPLDLV